MAGKLKYARTRAKLVAVSESLEIAPGLAGKLEYVCARAKMFAVSESYEIAIVA